MATVYCGTCGTDLGETAKFCRSCGAAQVAADVPQPPPPATHQPAQPPPPPPAQPGQATFAPPVAQPLSTASVVAAVLAIVGGAALCVVVLYGTIYQPLHYEFSMNYGEPIRFVDLLALGSGLAAIAIGVLVLRRRPGSSTTRGILLVAAGTPTLILSLIWSFPDAFNLSIYPVPFYFGYVYAADLGIVRSGDMYLRLPLILACGMMIAAGIVVAASSRPRVVSPAGPR